MIKFSLVSDPTGRDAIRGVIAAGAKVPVRIFISVGPEAVSIRVEAIGNTILYPVMAYSLRIIGCRINPEVVANTIPQGIAPGPISMSPGAIPVFSHVPRPIDHDNLIRRRIRLAS
ncbi:MAG TPA: hypothetical protein VIU33_08430 [Nitrospiria bacterium]